MVDKQSNKSSDKLAAADLSASAETALQALQRAGEQSVALVEAWVKAGNAAAVNEASERAQGAARKAARRGLNVLKARGVAVPTACHVTSVTGDRKSSKAAANTGPATDSFMSDGRMWISFAMIRFKSSMTGHDGRKRGARSVPHAGHCRNANLVFFLALEVIPA